MSDHKTPLGSASIVNNQQYWTFYAKEYDRKKGNV